MGLNERMSNYGPKPRPIGTRFWEKVQFGEGCWASLAGACSGCGCADLWQYIVTEWQWTARRPAD